MSKLNRVWRVSSRRGCRGPWRSPGAGTWGRWRGAAPRRAGSQPSGLEAEKKVWSFADPETKHVCFVLLDLPKHKFLRHWKSYNKSKPHLHTITSMNKERKYIFGLHISTVFILEKITDKNHYIIYRQNWLKQKGSKYTHTIYIPGYARK